jgi:hypothetical protein
MATADAAGVKQRANVLGADVFRKPHVAVGTATEAQRRLFQRSTEDHAYTWALGWGVAPAAPPDSTARTSRLVALVLGRHIVGPQHCPAHYPAHGLISRSRPLCVKDPCVSAPDADVARVFRLLSLEENTFGACAVAMTAMTVVAKTDRERTFSLL